MAKTDAAEVATMHPDACLGFSGGVLGGLHSVTYAGEPFVCFPLGAMVVVKHATKRDGVCFLRGHTQAVSCVAVSHDGCRLASGQRSMLGVSAPVCVWDLEDACARILAPLPGAGPPAPVHVLRQHLSGVQALAYRRRAGIRGGVRGAAAGNGGSRRRRRGNATDAAFASVETL